MIETKTLLLIIVLMSIVTYLPRVIPLYINIKKWPNWLRMSLDFVPVSMIAVIVIPAIIVKSYDTWLVTAELIAMFLTIAIAYYSKNLMITVLLSLTLYLGMTHYLF